jgi:hypothetical protein
MKKSFAVSTVGPVGQAYSITEKNWNCTECKAENFPRRERCFKCKAARPAGAIEASFAPALASGMPSLWKEAFDPKSRQIYYYNTQTMETSWSRPAELGPAPYATGAVGRGAVGNTAQEQLEARNREWLLRPARKQQDIDPSQLQRAEGANEYNIWYNKAIGDYSKGGMGKDPAPTRCYPDTDAGFTRPSRSGAIASNDRVPFCLHFARGMCARGQECFYYHHIPTAADDAAADVMKDVFGRLRHTTHRDDMSGTGSITSDSRTLYVGGLRKIQGVDLEQLVRKHFEIWGEIENVNIVHRISVAFVRYRCRTSAEFALVAMANQNMGHSEVLNVKWAMDDPNPVAKQAKERADADLIAAALAAKGYTFDAEAEGGGDAEGEGQGEGSAAVPVGPSAHPLMLGDGSAPAAAAAAYPGGGGLVNMGYVPPTLASYTAAPPVMPVFAPRANAAAASASAVPSDALSALVSSSSSAAAAAPQPAPAQHAPPFDPNSPEYASWYYHVYLPSLGYPPQQQQQSHMQAQQHSQQQHSQPATTGLVSDYDEAEEDAQEADGNAGSRIRAREEGGSADASTTAAHESQAGGEAGATAEADGEEEEAGAERPSKRARIGE